MGELEEKLNAILGDPAAMEHIFSLAQSLGTSAPPSGEPPESGGPDPEKTGPSLQGEAPLDPKLLQLGMRLWQEYQTGNPRTAALLEALRPFLREKRRARLDRAAQIARLSHVIRIALQVLGERQEEEHV